MAPIDDDADDDPPGPSLVPWTAPLLAWISGPAHWLARCFVVAMVPAATIVAAGWQWAVGPRLAILAQRAAANRALADTHARLSAVAAAVPTLRARRDRLARGVAEGEQSLPGYGDIDALVASLHDAALRNRLYFERIQPEPLMAGADALALRLRAHGAYRQIAAWLRDVAALPGAVTMRQLALHPALAADRLVLDAVAIAHLAPRRQPRPAAALVLEQAGARATRDPFARQRLDGMAPPADDIAMVGMLRAGGRRYGIVRADGEIGHVGIGDRLGRRGGRVVRIDDDAIAWREPSGQGEGAWIDRRSTLQADRIDPRH